MRLHICLLVAACSLISALPSSAQDSRVAAYYTNNPEKYEGKKITLNCAFVERTEYGPDLNSENVTFYAYTASRSEYKTSYIYVSVPSENAAAFSKKYGFDSEYDARGGYRVRPLSGIFKKSGSVYFVEYTPNS